MPLNVYGSMRSFLVKLCPAILATLLLLRCNVKAELFELGIVDNYIAQRCRSDREYLDQCLHSLEN